MVHVVDSENPALSVIGLGYIGLPTAVAFALNGWDVTGVDVNQGVVDLINDGILPFEEANMEDALNEVLKAGSFRAQTDQRPADVYIIAVPTPFHLDKTADLSYIQAAAEAIGPLVKDGDLVVSSQRLLPAPPRRWRTGWRLPHRRKRKASCMHTRQRECFRGALWWRSLTMTESLGV